jgi:predicted ATPase
MVGTTYLTKGRFDAALRHLKRAQALFDPDRDTRLRFQFSQDIGVAASCYQSLALLHLGSVEQASIIADEAIRRAERLSDPHTLVYAVCHARALMDLFRRRSGDVKSNARFVISVCSEHKLWHWLNCGHILEGWATICDGDLDPGIEILRAGIAAWKKSGARLWLPIFTAMEAEAYAKAGRKADALQTIGQAIAVSAETGEGLAIAEILRIKASLLLSMRPAEVNEIETLLIRSLKIARQQGARYWELRASCDLARWRQKQGRLREARQLLTKIYDQFTEGFNTTELREAKDLIDSMEMPLNPGVML